MDHLESTAGFVHAHQCVLEGKQTRSRGHMPGVVASIDVEKSVVPFLDVLDQLLNLIKSKPDEGIITSISKHIWILCRSSSVAEY